MNTLHLESSGSWGGQEYRTCLEINWLNAHGHSAWLICDPKSEVFSKAKELGTRVSRRFGFSRNREEGRAMYEGKIVFAQLMEHLPLHTLRRCIERFGGDRSVKGFSCQDQFRCIAFAQLTYRDSLRDLSGQDYDDAERRSWDRLQRKLTELEGERAQLGVDSTSGGQRR